MSNVQEKYYATGNAGYLALAGQPLHFRNIQTSAALTAAGNVQIRAELHDYLESDGYQKVHNKVFRIEIDPATHKVVAAEFGMPKGGPHAVCDQLPVGGEALVGLVAGANLARAARKLYRRTNGCTHILSLIEATIPVIHQATAFLIHIPNMKKQDGGEATKTFVAKLNGACHAMSPERQNEMDIEKTVYRYTDFVRYKEEEEHATH